MAVSFPPDIETLWHLVAHYSPSGQERAAVDWLVQRFHQLGYTKAMRDQAGNAVGVMGAGPNQIVLLGHIDTVPGKIPLRIAHTPEEGEVLFGRGSVDAKGPLAPFSDAVAAVGPRPGWQFIVVGAVDEERESTGARFIAQQPHYRPAYAIIGEPSHWERVTLGYKGSARARVRLSKPLAHTAAQDLSAAEEACAWWQNLTAAVAEQNQARPRAFDQLQPTLRGLTSGEDGFTQWAELHVGCRLPPDISPAAWYAQMAAISPQAEVTAEGYAIPAYRGEKRTPLTRAFLGAIRQAGGRPGFVVKTGTADLNIVAPRWGCPAVAYGPGDSSLDHTPHEHLPLDHYRRSVRVLQAVLQRLSAG